MRSEAWSALFQIIAVVGALGAFGWARMPLLAARLRLRSLVDLEIENLSRSTARQVTVEMRCDEPFSDSDLAPPEGPWKWGLADMGPGQKYSCDGIRERHLMAGVSVKVRWRGIAGLPRSRSYEFGGPELANGLVFMRKPVVTSGGSAESKDARAIAKAIQDHARAIVDHSD